MDIEAARQLDEAIDAALRMHKPPSIHTVRLGPGSEVMDLTMNATVRVQYCDDRERTFTIVSQERVERLFANADNWVEDWQRDFKDIFTSGGPLAIVREITGDTIVRAVIRYTSMELMTGG